ncbi:hypothetical protein Tco_0923328 [Tanacetum coccineum]|uniref:Uncharacterized protein n=1 Tax=Tanacetum coccineum TaxID=301880 RepID=A0ABQ5D737_9ASTR
MKQHRSSRYQQMEQSKNHRKEEEGEIGSLETRLNNVSDQEIYQEIPTSPMAVPAVPNIFGDRPAYQRAATRRTLPFLSFSGEEGGDDCGLDSNEGEVVPNVEEVSLADGVFDGAFGGDGDDDFVIGEGVMVSSSSFVKSTKSCLGEMMVSLIFLEWLEEEARVEVIEVEEK